MLPLAGGTVRYLAPPGWKAAAPTADGLHLGFTLDEKGGIVVDVTPQETAPTQNMHDQMAVIIGKAIRESARSENHTFVITPRVEPDDRFFLKLHDAQTVAPGVIADRLQLYREIGLNLVHVAVTAQVSSVDQSAPIHAAAEKLLDGMRLSRGAKRTVYPRAELRAVVPLDWREAKIDQPNGLVARYTDPDRPPRQIIVRVRLLPKDAQTDPARRDGLVQLMVDQERHLPPLSISSPAVEQPAIGSGNNLRQTRFTVKSDGQTLRVDTRYLVVGSVLVSVRSVAANSDADAVNAIAEKYCENLKPIGE